MNDAIRRSLTARKPPNAPDTVVAAEKNIAALIFIKPSAFPNAKQAQTPICHDVGCLPMSSQRRCPLVHGGIAVPAERSRRGIGNEILFSLPCGFDVALEAGPQPPSRPCVMRVAYTSGTVAFRSIRLACDL
jgi:hypothetical protein